MRITENKSDNIVQVCDFGGTESFSLADTLDCGQCFRFFEQEDNSYIGVVNNNVCHVKQEDNTLFFYNCSIEEFNSTWRIYFDLDRNYLELKETFKQDEQLAKAVEYAPGIRILRQDGWEALCSFIISQNNNIKRIKGIIQRLCESYGEELPNNPGYYKFPDASVIAKLSIDDLAPLRCGFRSKYILDAAKKVSSGEVNLEELKTAPLVYARESLTKINGVGTKVAECALLYGLNRLEAFPIDVWIKRAMEQLFPDGLPENAVPFAGIAQQYIFHYVRTGENVVEI